MKTNNVEFANKYKDSLVFLVTELLFGEYTIGSLEPWLEKLSDNDLELFGRLNYITCAVSEAMHEVLWKEAKRRGLPQIQEENLVPHTCGKVNA